MNLLFDIETNGVDFSDGNFIDSVSNCWCICICNLDTGSVSTYYDTHDLRVQGTGSIAEGLRILEEADEISGHNIIQFDLSVLRKLFNFKPKCRIFDTLVASRTLLPDRIGGHSLRAWGGRLGYPKGEFDDFTKFSPELLRYCRQDVTLNAKVYKVLNQEIQQGDWNKAIDLEHQIARIIAEQEAIGFYFNVPQAQDYTHKWEATINDIDNDITSIVPGHLKPGPGVTKPFKVNGELAKRALDIAEAFRIDTNTIAGPFTTFEFTPYSLESKAQQKELLLRLGWQPEQKTPTGLPKLDDSILKITPIGPLLSERNILSHRRSQVQGLLNIVDGYGRVHGGANPCGTNTARMRHTRITNIPRLSSKLGRELRSLFSVPIGKKLVGYDAKSLELRILAHYIGNEQYNEAVTTTDRDRDAHVLAARAAGVHDRELGKTINYALIFGAGDKKLGSFIGGGEEEGKRLRAELYNRIPGFETLVRQAKSTTSRGYINTLDGRKLYLRRRVSPVNTLIQGGGAIVMKTVAAKLDELTKELHAFKVVDMHDEAQWECPSEEVDALSSFIDQSFEHACSTLNLRCQQAPDIKVGTNWAETH